MRFGEVCTGIACASVAWEPLGFEPVFFSEVDRGCNRLLRERYPNVPNHGDMNRFEDWPEHAIDALVGGTPCQAFSVAGLREGFRDPRGGLALVFLEIARRYRPRWLVWENVAGVLSLDGGRAFGAFLGGLAELGYGFAYRILDAQFVRTRRFRRAVPQRRRRVFVVGYLGNWRRAAAVLFERESMSGDNPPSRSAGQAIAGTLAPRTHGGGGLGTDFEADGGLIPAVANCLTERTSKGVNSDLNEGQTLIGFDCRGTEVQCLPGIAPPLRTMGHIEGATSRGNGHGQLAVAFAENSRAEVRLEGGDGGVAGALKAKGGKAGQSYPAIAVRRLTPRECERLMGVPDDYTRVRTRRGHFAKDATRYRQLGNGIAINCLEWIGERMKMVEGIGP